MDHYKDQEVAKEREKAKKLVELLHEIDKSLYIGDDLNDIDILKWYLDVICTIKDEIKQSLTEYGV
jgi:soluble P-type ATPase